MIFVTGGAGFIGANFVLDWLATTGEPVVNIDKLTYAGNLENLASVRNDARHSFVHVQAGAGLVHHAFDGHGAGDLQGKGFHAVVSF